MAEKQKKSRETLKVKSLEFLFAAGVLKGQPVLAHAEGGHTEATAYQLTAKLQSLTASPERGDK